MKLILLLILVALPWQGRESYTLVPAAQEQSVEWPSPQAAYHWWRDVCAIPLR